MRQREQLFSGEIEKESEEPQALELESQVLADQGGDARTSSSTLSRTVGQAGGPAAIKSM